MENLELAMEAARVLNEKKGIDIKVIDVAEKSSFADYLLIVSGGSDRQVGALADAVERSGGRPLEVTYLRDGTERVCTVMPVKETNWF